MGESDMGMEIDNYSPQKKHECCYVGEITMLDLSIKLNVLLSPLLQYQVYNYTPQLSFEAPKFSFCLTCQNLVMCLVHWWVTQQLECVPCTMVLCWTNPNNSIRCTIPFVVLWIVVGWLLIELIDRQRCLVRKLNQWVWESNTQPIDKAIKWVWWLFHLSDLGKLSYMITAA